MCVSEREYVCERVWGCGGGGGGNGGGGAIAVVGGHGGGDGGAALQNISCFVPGIQR